MKLFSKLYRNKKNEENNEKFELVEQSEDLQDSVSSEYSADTGFDDTQSDTESAEYIPSDNLQNIASKFDNYSQTKPFAHQLREFIGNPDTKKTEYFKLLSKLQSSIEQERQKEYLKDSFIDLQHKVKNISELKFISKFKGFENFYNDFPHLTTEFKLLDMLKSWDPNIFTDSELQGLHGSFEILNSAFVEATNESQALKEAQDNLSDEIKKYSQTANEYKQKYRFSVDWDGKKPFMISQGKKLTEKRNALVEKETALNSELQILYEEYPGLHDKFLDNLIYFSHCLDKAIGSFKQNDIEISAIIEISSAFETTIKNEL